MKNLTLLFSLIFLFCTGIVSAQMNFDVFFKNSTQYDDVLITEVFSADTFRIENGDLIKLIGLKAPKSPKKERVQRDEAGFVIEKKIGPAVGVEDQAFDFAEELLLNQRVKLEFDVNRVGEKNVTLAYAFLLEDNLFINAAILEKGFADLGIRPPNLKYENELRAAYQEARKNFRGLHN